MREGGIKGGIRGTAAVQDTIARFADEVSKIDVKNTGRFSRSEIR